ncbi:MULTISPECIES: ATP-dependent DNA helicase RecG [Tsukamurella]|uniref:ATP-dependent DNA helicase RecG n=1 Tax=Tsukamurella strandjordii TaxID=147577 RepID=A0AA90SMA4_9ACTN|nr:MULTISPECIES: ATP-dependent DNA helicase RecG [Tsukamurella]MDP0399038.1 ATP-dependent DNA helicase RecG [Tsukamurella strandjordii]GIZ95899.1 ATP-dependent DNA helicase RecG [Tsukamurella sp. TY48]
MSPAADLTLQTPLVDAIDPEIADQMTSELGLITVGDLLRHFPFRYEGGASIDEGTRATEPKIGDDVVVIGTVTAVTPPRAHHRGKKMFKVQVVNKVRAYDVTFFNYLPKPIQPGRQMLLIGRLGEFNHKLQLTHPDWLVLPDDDMNSAQALAANETGATKAGSKRLKLANLALLTGPVVPIYHGTKNMPTWLIASIVDAVLGRLAPVPESLPAEFRTLHGLLDLDQALRVAHFPKRRTEADAARRRLAFDEAVAIETALARRAHDVGTVPAPSLAAPDGPLQTGLRERLPFQLTDGQEEVLAEILGDLSRDHPMTRLLQGEVGSGKTLVALLAMLAAVDAGYQAVLLAPTEVLATQHMLSITKMLGDLGEAGQLGAAEAATTVTLLTGSMNTKARRAALLRIVTGEAGIVIGTHALLEDTVDFFRLGLVVVDEQHRFGVEQRDRLRRKGPDDMTPHLLVMTATPIPRTVALAQFGDMSTSVLRELPRGRQPIQTSVVPQSRPGWIERAWARVDEEVRAGRQVYVVCPRIGDDPTGEQAKSSFTDEDYQFEQVAAPSRGKSARAEVAEETEPQDDQPRMTSAIDMYAQLVGGELAEHRIALLHGRLPAEEKSEIMAEFAAGDVDVLVATTVIEVGVDVANATTMVVMDAERFGISQLHQLRGRVGRGGLPGLCLLVTDTPSPRTMERLEAVAGTVDGFALAQLDLEHRGFGDILGVDQSGLARRLSFLDLANDGDVLDAARALAFEVIDADPELEDHVALREMNAVILGGSREDYLDKA